jgi:hypothetical protein
LSSSKTPEVLLFSEHLEEVVDAWPRAIKNTCITMSPDYLGTQNDNQVQPFFFNLSEPFSLLFSTNLQKTIHDDLEPNLKGARTRNQKSRENTHVVSRC